jgi:hypothetical protein
VCVCVCVCACVCVCVCIYMRMYIYIYVYMYICLYVYMYVYIYPQTHTHTHMMYVLNCSPPHRFGFGTAKFRVGADLVARGGVQLWGLAECAWYVCVEDDTCVGCVWRRILMWSSPVGVGRIRLVCVF